jgi:predicted GIY-YIG superfamily endonuclease
MQYLYRAFNKEGELLYIGISSQWHHRLHQHEKTSAWIEEADHVTIERFPDRETVAEAERRAVLTEKPRDNKVFAHDYESPAAHWAKIKKWVKSGEAPDYTHQMIVTWMRETAFEVYQNKPAQLRPKAIAFLFLQEVELAARHGFRPCRNCAGVWNSSIIQPGYEGGEEQLLEVAEKNGAN